MPARPATLRERLNAVLTDYIQNGEFENHTDSQLYALLCDMWTERNALEARERRVAEELKAEQQ